MTGIFNTKDALRKEDIDLTIHVNDIEKRYRDVYQSVQDLDLAYQSCKGNFPSKRYGDLKAMIKACVTDAVIEEAKRYTATGSAEDQWKRRAIMWVYWELPDSVPKILMIILQQ